jgi:beta-galactosidase/beta-glucuronidase
MSIELCIKMKAQRKWKLKRDMAIPQVLGRLRTLKSVPQFIFLSLIFLSASSVWAATWAPAAGPLKTRWAKDVSPKNAHPEYPRPQMVRQDWLNLNGLWDFAITNREATRATFQTQILVPFPVESALSGVMRMVSENDRIWYRRTFEVPGKWRGQRVLLHFGAVDFEATVLVNGKQVAQHRGGYDAFSADITAALNSSGPNELVVVVWDPTDASTQPRGKQVRKPHSIWYTPTSGIWQTVWLEPVNAAYIADLKITPDVDNSAVTVHPVMPPMLGRCMVEATIRDGNKVLYTASVSAGGKVTMPVKKARLWSPEDPHLYNLVVSLKLGSRTIDKVESYFGMRKISLGKDGKGFTRLMLNNKPYFQFGPLDQGFWPDGLYTAPTDEALRYDIEMTKQLGFNLARKHVKIEPDRWYYWCDKLGLLVWQDMPSGDKYIGPKDPDITRSPESAKEFEQELTALVQGRGNHPCIVMWVPYNEGWGQWDTARIVELTRKLDPTRLVDNTSGWSDRGVGDVNDMHKYPGPGSPQPEADRAAVLGEFGGLGLPVSGHTWQSEKNWGYRSFTNAEALTTAYIDLVGKLFPLIGEKGLSAAIYTQTTDVEIEVNGLMTYDRALVKMDLKKVAAVNYGYR